MTEAAATSSFDLSGWLERHFRSLLWGLVLIAGVTRIALVAGSPRPFGYVWDLYHEGVIWTFQHHQLPGADDCGECYHPPLFIICTEPLYALGASKGGPSEGLRALSLFSMACAAVVVYFCFRILQLLYPQKELLLLGLSLALVFPCLFIASYSAENDILLAALMSAFFYSLCRYQRRPGRASWTMLLSMGILAGLSALTKYSGLLTLVTAGVLLAWEAAVGRRRRLKIIRDLAVITIVATAVCGWHYGHNLRSARKPLLGPPWAPNVFAVGLRKVALNRHRYDFLSLKIRDVVDLYDPGRKGMLNDFPIYGSVLSTMNALAWTDMSFFSVPSRHGWKLPEHYAEPGTEIRLVAQAPASQARVDVYPPKQTIPWLIDLVLRLGLVPSILAVVGFFASLRRRTLRPFAAYAVCSLGVYFWWVLAQDAWALKTKYILFLLPVYVVYAITGLRATMRLDRRLGAAATVAFVAALVVSEAYLWMFALGSIVRV